MSNWTDQDVLKWADSAMELEDKCMAVCKDLTSHHCELAQIVEKLGPILTHTDVEQRRKGIQFLTQLLYHLPKDFLQENELKFILAFYNERLRDHHSLVPQVLSGVHTLSRMKHAREEDVLRLLFTILSGTIFTCQSQQREERSKIFDLIIFCSGEYYETLIKRKNDYIQGVINSVEGERDPRNLVKLFDFMPSFLDRYPLEHWADEMFEVFACYYPIDFYPSPNDPNAITRDGLAAKLEMCLLGCRDFIELAVTLALEKIETDLKVAKLDSLAMIRNCATKFGCKEMEKMIENIWLCLKQELMPGQNEDVIRAGLEALRFIVAEAKEESVRTNILTVTFNSIAISLCDVNLRLFYPAVRVASALGNAGPEAAAFIGDKVAPIFLRQLRDCNEENEEKKITILGLLKDITSIANEKNCLNALDREILVQVEDVFVGCLSQSDENSRTIGYFGLMELCPETRPETRSIIYTELLSLLKSGASPKIPVTACVTRFVQHFPEEVLNDLIQLIIGDGFVVTQKNCEEVFRILGTLLGPCNLDNEAVYKFLLGYIFYFPGTTLNLDDEMEGDQNSRLLLVLLDSLNGLLNETANDHVAKTLYKTHRLVERLMEVRDRFQGDFILNPLSLLLTHIVSAQSEDQQGKEIDRYLPQLQVSSGNDLYFINGLLAKCSNAVSLEGKFEVLVLDLIRSSLTEGNASKKQMGDHLLCFLFNRNYAQVDSFDRLLGEAVEFCQQSMAVTGRGIQTLAWIAKGLLTKGHPKAEELIVKIINGLQDPTLSSSIADAFECLAQPTQIYLPNKRMFFKQKLFELVCKNLLSADTQLNSAQLKAISRILSELPAVVLRMHLTMVGPILFRCLDHEDTHTVLVSLKLFHRLIGSDEKFCQEHIQFLIAKFLKLSQYKGNLHIRTISLNCLFSVSKYPTYLLMPFKQDVLFSTVPALDDHKRIVRAAAVEARTKWFLLDSPIKEK